MIGLLIQLLILCLVLGLVLFLFQNIPILAPFSWVAYVICVVILVLWLINLLGGAGGSVFSFPAYRGGR